MKSGRRNFLKGLFGTSLITTQVFAEKQSESVIEDKFTKMLEDPRFNCVIIQRRGNDYDRPFVYKAARYDGSVELQKGDMVMWDNEQENTVVLYDYITAHSEHYGRFIEVRDDNKYAGTVSTVSQNPLSYEGMHKCEHLDQDDCRYCSSSVHHGYRDQDGWFWLPGCWASNLEGSEQYRKKLRLLEQHGKETE